MPRTVPKFEGINPEGVDLEKYERVREMIRDAEKEIFDSAPELWDQANWKPLILDSTDPRMIQVEKWKEFLNFLEPIKAILEHTLPYREGGDLEEVVRRKIDELV